MNQNKVHTSPFYETIAINRLLEAIPRNSEFHAVDIANKLYPNSVKYDTEGRCYNRAVPTVVRMLREIHGVQEVRKCVFYAHVEFFEGNH